MKHFYINFLLIGLLLSQSRIGDWNAYTSPLHINNLTEYNNLIICATDGGLLIYNKNQNSYFSNQSRILKQIDEMKKFNLNEKNTFIWIKDILQNEAK